MTVCAMDTFILDQFYELDYLDYMSVNVTLLWISGEIAFK